MYLNTFINLEENISGYGKISRKPTGHTIITMPGMVRLYLQDLKDLSGKEYICYALSKKDNKAVRLGSVNVPSENKMTNFRIDINNVGGKGVRADNIDCIAVVIEGDTVGNTDTVILGYAGEKYLITPILEKGLPKREVVKERKDKIPTVGNKGQKPVEGPGPVVVQKPVEGPGPVVVQKPVEGLGPVVVQKPVEGLGPVVVQKPEEGPGPVVVQKPEEGPGPVVVQKPEEGPGPVVVQKPVECLEIKDKGIESIEEVMQKLEMDKLVEEKKGEALQKIIKGLNTAQQTKPEEIVEKKQEGGEVQPKKECGCNKPVKQENGCKIKEFIERLENNETDRVELSEKIEAELKDLISQGISKEEILDKKNILEDQIKDLINNKMSDKNTILEDKLKEELNKQFDMGYDLNREYSKVNEEDKIGDVMEQETSKEEIDFLDQLEDKLKGLQSLLKTTMESKVQNENEQPYTPEVIERECENEYTRVREIFETSSEMQPFEQPEQPVEWVRISLAELISIPQLSYEWATQPFITFSYHKYNHLILGKDKEIEQYYIGIPDIYQQTRNHILEIDKIERFVCRNTSRLTTGEAGYWIAMI